jgi:hypothetical protein
MFDNLRTMFLKAPGLLVFTVSVLLALLVLYARYFGTDVPFLMGDASQFYGMLIAYVILALGCTMRGLWQHHRSPTLGGSKHGDSVHPRLIKLKFLAKTVSCHTVLAASPIEASWAGVARRFDINALLEQWQDRRETACEPPLGATANASCNRSGPSPMAPNRRSRLYFGNGGIGLVFPKRLRFDRTPRYHPRTRRNNINGPRKKARSRPSSLAIQRVFCASYSMVV